MHTHVIQTTGTMLFQLNGWPILQGFLFMLPKKTTIYDDVIQQHL